MDKELENILEKVSTLYNKYGIKSVTMDDVARELGISKKTLYKYVSDKKDLVSKSVDYQISLRKININCLAKNELSAIEELLMVNKFVNEMLKDHSPTIDYDLRKYYPDLFDRIIDAKRNEMHKCIISNMIKGKSEGLYREDIDEEMITKLYIQRVETLISTDYFSREEVLKPEFINELFEYHIRGIANEKGIKLYEEKIKSEE